MKHELAIDHLPEGGYLLSVGRCRCGWETRVSGQTYIHEGTNEDQIREDHRVHVDPAVDVMV